MNSRPAQSKTLKSVFLIVFLIHPSVHFESANLRKVLLQCGSNCRIYITRNVKNGIVSATEFNASRQTLIFHNVSKRKITLFVVIT